MSTEFIPVHRGNVLVDLEECLPLVRSGSLSYGDLLRTCGFYRVHGLLALAAELDGPALRDALGKSAQTFAEGLEGISQEDRLLAKARPLVDAIAVRATSVARRIAAAVLREHTPGREYPEDFHFLDFLIRLHLEGADDETLEATLDAHERGLDGADDPRLPLCRALLERDADAFQQRFDELREGYRERMDRLHDAEALSEEEFLAEGRFWVEGMALLVVAEERGLPVPDETPLIPSNARATEELDLAPDAWLRP